MAAVESPTKKAKVDEVADKKDVEMKDAEKTKIEPPKELETDTPAGAKSGLKEKVWFNTADTTINLMPSTSGGLLKSLMDGGFQFLLAGARANVGLKSGRYMFEVKIVDQANYSQDAGVKTSIAKQYLRVGFSTAGSSLIAGADEHSVCFDSAGFLWHDAKKGAGCGRALTLDCVATVLLNLDEKSPNFNTVSLFKDGQRLSQPQALPDSMKGKTLFPTVAFKNLTVHVNFGPQPLAPLPFTCRMVGDASTKDASVAEAPAPTDGKYEVVVPVGLPDEGTYEWLDIFHKKNPGFTEISARTILAWAEKSGLWRKGGYKALTCNDHPQMNTEITSIDDGSVSRMIKSFAPLQNRNYVIMEVRGNLIKEEREALLARFSSAVFRKVAQVQLGEPTLEFKKAVQVATLKTKQDLSDVEFGRKKAAEKAKKLGEMKLRNLEKLKKRAETQRARKLKEAQELRKKQEAEAKEGAKEGEADKETKEEEKKEDEAEVVSEDEKEVEEAVEAPPKVALDAEEKKLWFVKSATPDLTPYALSINFAKFSAPEKAEGFDDIRYDWEKAPKCQEYMKKWVLEKKTSTRVEDLAPSPWFKQKSLDWVNAVKSWNTKSNEYRAACNKKEAEKLRKKQAAVVAAAKAKADEQAKAKAAEEGKAETICGLVIDIETKAKPMEVDDEPEEVTIDFAALDVFGVEDVMDVGGGMPLFKDFGPEDWAMMALRHELHLMAHAFRREINDPERTGIHLDHLAFYYQKYYSKQIVAKTYGVESFNDLVA